MNNRDFFIRSEELLDLSQGYNCIYYKSCECMDEIESNSIALTVTSPPYNVGKSYESDLSLDDYLNFLDRVFNEVYRVTIPGGRLAVNIANTGRTPYVPLSVYILQLLIKHNWLMRGEIIWDKGASVGSSTAWGSWCKATNPFLRDVHEYIMIFSKETYKRSESGKESTLSSDDFTELTRSVWRFNTVNASRIGHPAPFPVELPERLINLYSFKDDVILDPFMGSGTTAIAAIKTKRRFVGYEIRKDYCETAEKRIVDHLLSQ